MGIRVLLLSKDSSLASHEIAEFFSKLVYAGEQPLSVFGIVSMFIIFQPPKPSLERVRKISRDGQNGTKKNKARASGTASKMKNAASLFDKAPSGLVGNSMHR